MHYPHNNTVKEGGGFNYYSLADKANNNIIKCDCLSFDYAKLHPELGLKEN